MKKARRGLAYPAGYGRPEVGNEGLPPGVYIGSAGRSVRCRAEGAPPPAYTARIHYLTLGLCQPLT